MNVGDGCQASLGMRRNDDRLQEMLLLAKACLKTGRCPGDFRPRDFYNRFDAEVADAEAAEAQAQEPSPSRPASPPPVEPLPDDMPSEARASRLRRDLKVLTRVSGERRKELESLHQEWSGETLARCQADELLGEAKEELRKSQRALGEVREMYRLQARELEDLRAAIDAAQTSAAVSSSAPGQKSSTARSAISAGDTIPPGPAPPTDPVKTRAAGPSPQGCQNSMAPAAAVPPPGGYLASTRRAASAGAPGGSRGASAKEQPRISAEDLKSALLKDQKANAAEAKLWGHLQSENEKLASVIDAVNELGRHIRSPNPSLAGPGGSSSAKVPEVSQEEKARATAVAAGLLAPVAKKQAYASVLASRPKHYKLYFV